MATLKETNLTNVYDSTTDNEGNNIPKLKYFGDLSENAKLEFDPLTFEAYGKFMHTTNRQLATIIKEFYGKTFHDLRGVNITYNPGNPRAPFDVIMYFAVNALPKPEGKINNLTDLTVAQNGDKTSLYWMKKAVDNKAGGKHYTLNEQTKLLLGDIMYGGKDANKPASGCWNGFITEVWVPTSDMTYNPRAGELLIEVKSCFDFHRVLKKIFGNTMVTKTDLYTDADGQTKAKNFSAEAAYEARFVKYALNEPNVFIMNVEQFDKVGVEEAAGRENPVRRSAVSGVIYFG